MPVLSVILQPVGEGVRALEGKEHTHRSEEPTAHLPRRTKAKGRGGFSIAVEKK